MNTEALQEAIKRAGGQTALAKGINRLTGRRLRQGNVWVWLNRSKIVPAEFAIPIETITGVSRHETRPDLYPIEPASPRAENGASTSSNTSAAA